MCSGRMCRLALVVLVVWCGLVVDGFPPRCRPPLRPVSPNVALLTLAPSLASGTTLAPLPPHTNSLQVEVRMVTGQPGQVWLMPAFNEQNACVTVTPVDTPTTHTRPTPQTQSIQNTNPSWMDYFRAESLAVHLQKLTHARNSNLSENSGLTPTHLEESVPAAEKLSSFEVSSHFFDSLDQSVRRDRSLSKVCYRATVLRFSPQHHIQGLGVEMEVQHYLRRTEGGLTKRPLGVSVLATSKYNKNYDNINKDQLTSLVQLVKGDVPTLNLTLSDLLPTSLHPYYQYSGWMGRVCEEEADWVVYDGTMWVPAELSNLLGRPHDTTTHTPAPLQPNLLYSGFSGKIGDLRNTSTEELTESEEYFTEGGYETNSSRKEGDWLPGESTQSSMDKSTAGNNTDLEKSNTGRSSMDYKSTTTNSHFNANLITGHGHYALKAFTANDEHSQSPNTYKRLSRETPTNWFSIFVDFAKVRKDTKVPAKELSAEAKAMFPVIADKITNITKNHEVTNGTTPLEKTAIIDSLSVLFAPNISKDIIAPLIKMAAIKAIGAGLPDYDSSNSTDVAEFTDLTTTLEKISIIKAFSANLTTYVTGNLTHSQQLTLDNIKYFSASFDSTNTKVTDKTGTLLNMTSPVEKMAIMKAFAVNLLVNLTDAMNKTMNSTYLPANVYSMLNDATIVKAIGCVFANMPKDLSSKFCNSKMDSSTSTNSSSTSTNSSSTSTNSTSTPTYSSSTSTNSPSTVTESPSTVTESPSTVTESPSTVTESPSTVTESPSTATKSPSVPTNSPSKATSSTSTPTNHSYTATESPSTPANRFSTPANNSFTSTNTTSPVFAEIKIQPRINDSPDNTATPKPDSASSSAIISNPTESSTPAVPISNSPASPPPRTNAPAPASNAADSATNETTTLTASPSTLTASPSTLAASPSTPTASNSTPTASNSTSASNPSTPSASSSIPVSNSSTPATMSSTPASSSTTLSTESTGNSTTSSTNMTTPMTNDTTTTPPSDSTSVRPSSIVVVLMSLIINSVWF